MSQPHEHVGSSANHVHHRVRLCREKKSTNLSSAFPRRQDNPTITRRDADLPPPSPTSDQHNKKMPGLPASVDLDECISRLYKKELLAESVIEAICAKTKELLMRESNVVHVRAPVTVVGDIHGQFFDLIEIFKIGGWCPDTNYLFLGAPLSPASGPGLRSPRLDADMCTFDNMQATM